MYHQEKGIMRYGFVIFEILVVKVEFIATLVQDCLVPFKRLVVVIMDIVLRVGIFFDSRDDPFVLGCGFQRLFRSCLRSKTNHTFSLGAEF